MNSNELNEYLECTCRRCDDGICRCIQNLDEFPPIVSFDDSSLEDYGLD